VRNILHSIVALTALGVPGGVVVAADAAIDADEAMRYQPSAAIAGSPAPASPGGLRPVSLAMAQASMAIMQEDEDAEAARLAALPRTAFFEGWSRSAELGLNGSEGNSETFNFRVGLRTERITDLMETRASATYSYGSDDGSKTTNRANFSARNDWLFEESRWGAFALGRVEFDEFQDWEWRVSGFVGPSYTFIREDDLTLRGRVGAGGSRAFGGEDNKFRWEGLVGLDLIWQITERQSFFVTTEAYPSFRDRREFRTFTDAGYQILVDPEMNLSLRIGATHRYDSRPGPDTDKNDLEYFALLSLAF